MEDPGTKNRHSIRLRGFDYATEGVIYFVTIVVNFRTHLLGDYVDDELVLSEAGKMVARCLEDIPQKYEEFQLLEYVVMPNHVHFLIKKCGEGPRSLSDLMEAYKSFTTAKYIQGVKNGMWPPFEKHFWQRDYYDHIVRNERSYNLIVEYINNNPGKWIEDGMNEKCDPKRIYDINAEIKRKE